MQPERNTEGKMTLAIVIAGILASLGTAAKALLASGAIDQWPVAVAIAGIFVGLGIAAAGYSKSRGEVKAAREFAKTGAPPVDPSRASPQ